MSKRIRELADLSVIPNDARMPWDQSGTDGTVSTTYASLKAALGSGAVNIADPQFGAVAGGPDCLAAFNAAAAALPLGGTINVPPGAWYVSGELSLPNAVNLKGASRSTTKIVTTHATANVVKCAVGNNRIQDIGIYTSVTRTSPSAGQGAAIYIDSNALGVYIDNVVVDGLSGTAGSGFYYGVYQHSTHSVQIDRTDINNPVATSGIGFVFDNTGGGRMDHCFVRGAGGATPFAGVNVSSSYQLIIYGCDFLLCQNGMYVNPGNGQVVATTRSTSTFYDTNVTAGVYFAPTGTGKIFDSSFVDDWFANTSNGDGFRAVGGGSTSIDGTLILGGQAYNNIGDAIDVADVINFQVIGGFRAANNSGHALKVAGTCSKLTIIGNEFGPTGGSGANGGYGLSLAGSQTDFIFRYNNVSNNTGGAFTSSASYSGHCDVSHNPGYNTNPTVNGVPYYSDAVSQAISSSVKIFASGGFSVGGGDPGANNISSIFNILRGTTSGTMTLRSAAIAGTNAITFPAGTTDFSATGGAGQFVKQNSAGGALTVAAVGVSEVSGLGTGVATFLATPSSANLAAAVTGETGSGAVVFGTSPSIATPTFTGLITASGGQIAFPVSQSASSDPNTLDDYEEGTWTPTITFATPGNLSVAYSVQNGYYTKVGRVVSISFALTTSTFTHTTASGSLLLGGLPFTPCPADANYRAHSAAGWQGVTKVNYTNAYWVAIGNSATLVLGLSGSGVNIQIAVAADMPTGGTVNIGGQMTFNV